MPSRQQHRCIKHQITKLMFEDLVKAAEAPVIERRTSTGRADALTGSSSSLLFT